MAHFSIFVHIFSKFAELGSCRQVLKYLKQEEVLLPRRHCSGRQAGDLLWKPPTDAALYSILHNPAYAGTFAYGRRQMEPAKREPQHPGTGRLHRPMREWLHLQHDLYPAYITWERFLANQEKLRENSALYAWNQEPGRGPAREGEALLQGMAVCGLCGSRLQINYGATHRYECRNLARHLLDEMCCSLQGPSIDEAVVQAFFEALRPAQLDVLEAVLKQQSADRDRLDRQWREQISRAEYEARLAQRQYDAVDPDHRLVAAGLERRWEEKLQALGQVQEQYVRFQQRPLVQTLTAEQREQFQNLSETLPALWPTLEAAQQKELLRCLIAEVILKRIAPDQVEARIIWVSGHYTTLMTRPPIGREADVTGYDEMVRRVEQLWRAGWDSDEAMAEQLSAEGFHSARSHGVTCDTVQKIRLQRGWYATYHQSRNANTVQGWLTARGLAARVGVERIWVYKRLVSGEIDPTYVSRRPHTRIWLIKDDPELIAQLKQLLPAKHKSVDAAAARSRNASNKAEN